ncbi:GNAT family N-acetyltransferase [Micromonospora sp. NPDC051925]|uniref:GNAT family N-acetyltransferase n=1 Tax=Micromonospora sp. NPDC051925 TaxID=3364288 RepID=UPI0037C5A3C1
MFALPLAETAELRPLSPWHAGEFLTHLDRAREHIAPWVGASFVATDLDSAHRVLHRYAEKWANDAGGIWGIWVDGTLVGGVMFVSFDTVSGVAEAGCWLEPAAEGRGLVTRAATRIVDWAIRERGIHRVEWHARVGNVRSVAVARRLGMRHEGTLRGVAPGPAGRIDVEVWAVLAGEWPATTG